MKCCRCDLSSRDFCKSRLSMLSYVEFCTKFETIFFARVCGPGIPSLAPNFVKMLKGFGH